MDKQEKIYALNRLLANYFVIYIQLQRYIWYVKGEHSFTLRTMFKEMMQEWKVDIDKLADNILAIGGKPFATMIKFIKKASIEEASADDETEEIMEQLLENLTIIQKDIQQMMEQTDHQTGYFLSQLNATIWKYQMQSRAYLTD